ncbi:tRNA lysidine(34) synthetase TilS [Endothiovibrio diazotrophicus]
MNFEVPALLDQLLRLPPVRRFVVAFSGGRDSHVLLHAITSLAPLPGDVSVVAAHVDHTLHPDSSRWSAHCEAVCGELGVPCETIRVDARPLPGESPESAAREKRYGVLRRIVGEGSCLLTAHHRDDQAETFLIQLLRGGGPRGLAAMPRVVPFGGGWLARPLLPFSRDELAAYAEEHALRWIDDPSNFDTDFDRNYLRHRVMPSIAERWRGAPETLARAAGHNAEAAELLAQLAAIDLAGVAGSRPDTLSVSGLQALDSPRRRNALLVWFRRRALASPNARHLERLENDVLLAAVGAQPLLRWADVEVRRHRDDLYAAARSPGIPLPEVIPWSDLSIPLRLPDGRCLHFAPGGEGDIRLAAFEGARVSLRFRRDGERCRVAGRAHGRPLKKLLQESGLPPWERDRLPLLFLDDELAAVLGLWSCEPFAARPGEPAVRIVEES